MLINYTIHTRWGTITPSANVFDLTPYIYRQLAGMKPFDRPTELMVVVGCEVWLGSLCVLKSTIRNGWAVEVEAHGLCMN